MNLATIEVSKEEAVERLEQYGKLLYHERTVEDEAIAQAYRAAKRGLPILQLSEAFKKAGFFDNSLPRLAISRADQTQCFVNMRPEQMIFSDSERTDNRGALVGRHNVRVPVGPGYPVQRWRGQTAVPLVPPRHRPKRNRMRNFHVLWEVEEWTQLPAKDPALLRHIRGDLWTVLATWDLTDLERAVLSTR